MLEVGEEAGREVTGATGSDWKGINDEAARYAKQGGGNAMICKASGMTD